MRVSPPVITYLRIAAAVLVVVLIFVVWLHFDRSRRAAERARLAEAQSENNAETVRQVERHHDTVTIIREKEREAVDAVQAAPGADTPIDPDRRAIVCEQLSRLRNAPVCED